MFPQEVTPQPDDPGVAAPKLKQGKDQLINHNALSPTLMA